LNAQRLCTSNISPSPEHPETAVLYNTQQPNIMHAFSPTTGPQPLERPFVLRVVYLAIHRLDCDARARSLSSCIDYYHLMSTHLLNEHTSHALCFVSLFIFCIHKEFASLRSALPHRPYQSQPSIIERMSAAIELFLPHRRVVHLDGGAHGGRDVHGFPVDALGAGGAVGVDGFDDCLEVLR